MLENRLKTVNKKLKDYTSMASSQEKLKEMTMDSLKIKENVDTLLLPIKKLSEVNNYLNFKPYTIDLFEKDIIKIDEFILAVNDRVADPTVIREIKNKSNEIDQRLSLDWTRYYKSIENSALGQLSIVNGLINDKEKIKTIRKGIEEAREWKGLASVSTINRGSSRPKVLSESVEEVSKLVSELRLNDEITKFLSRVSTNRADILDLSPEILKWIQERNLNNVFSIRFRSED